MGRSLHIMDSLYPYPRAARRGLGMRNGFGGRWDLGRGSGKIFWILGMARNGGVARAARGTVWGSGFRQGSGFRGQGRAGRNDS